MMKFKNYLLGVVLSVMAVSTSGVLRAQNIVSPADNYGMMMDFSDEYPAESFFMSPIYDDNHNLLGFGMGNLIKYMYVRNDKGELTSKVLKFLNDNFDMVPIIEASQMINGSKRTILYLLQEEHDAPTFLYAISSDGDEAKESIQSEVSSYLFSYTSRDRVNCESQKRYNEAGQLASEFVTYFKPEYSDDEELPKHILREYEYDNQGRRISVKEFVTDSPGFDRGEEVYSSNVYFGDKTIRVEDKLLSSDYAEESIILEIKFDKNNRITEQNGFLNGEQIIRNRYSYTKRGETIGDAHTQFIKQLSGKLPIMYLLAEMTVDYKDSYDKNSQTTSFSVSLDSDGYQMSIKNTFDKKRRIIECQLNTYYSYEEYKQKMVKSYSRDGLTVEIRDYRMNNDTEKFILNGKTVKRYDNEGRVIGLERYTDDYRYYDIDDEVSEGDREFAVSYASEYTYYEDDRIRTFSYSYPDDNDVLQKHTKTEYLEYNDLGMPLLQKSYSWNSDINDWQLSMVSENSYYPDSYKSAKLEYKYWDSDSSAYSYGYKYEYYYDISESIKSETISSQFEVDSDKWIYYTKTENFHDGSSYIEYTWDSEQSEWIPQNKYENFEYYDWNAKKQEWELYSYDYSYDDGSWDYDDKYGHKLKDDKKPRYKNDKYK